MSQLTEANLAYREAMYARVDPLTANSGVMVINIDDSESTAARAYLLDVQCTDDEYNRLEAAMSSQGVSPVQRRKFTTHELSVDDQEQHLSDAGFKLKR